MLAVSQLQTCESLQWHLYTSANDSPGMLTLRDLLQVGGEYTRGNRNEGSYANKAGLIITGMIKNSSRGLC